jgi:hypothetical protein
MTRLATNLQVARVCRLLRDATMCAVCGKSTIVLNLHVFAGRGFQAEPITAETHCTCEGGPAHVEKGKTDADCLIVRGLLPAGGNA